MQINFGCIFSSDDDKLLGDSVKSLEGTCTKNSERENGVLFQYKKRTKLMIYRDRHSSLVKKCSKFSTSPKDTEVEK